MMSFIVLLSDRRDQIGIGDNKENKKHFLGARRLADKAALDHHAFHDASISRLSDASWCLVVDHKKI
jgi:hypothetical protein